MPTSIPAAVQPCRQIISLLIYKAKTNNVFFDGFTGVWKFDKK